MKSPNNPFVLAGYVSPEYFCNRQKELSWLESNYLNGRNALIYSWRRMGKTALIRHFFRNLEKDHGVETLYIDLMGAQSMPEAIKAITQAIHQRYGHSTSGISGNIGKLLSRLGMTVTFDPYSGFPKFSFGLTHLPPPEQSLDAIGEFLSNRKKSLVIAMDEFQQIGYFDEPSGEPVFRSWMQSFPHMRFIYSGSQRNMMRAMFTEQNRPFYKSVQILELESIPESEYFPFIRGHFAAAGKTIEDELLPEIYAWSRGQTYAIQLVCNKLFGLPGKPNRTKLQQVFSEIIEQEKPVFANYARLLTRKQWEVLKAIAISEPATNPQSKEFLQNHRLGAASSVATALKTLIKKELVIEENEGYFLHDVLLSHWLRQNP